MPEATRAKIAATLRGRKHSAERVAKAKANRPPVPKTDEEIVEATYRRVWARTKREGTIRIKQWRVDRIVATLRGWPALAEDVRQSFGYHEKRKLFDFTGLVSHGFHNGGPLWHLEVAPSIEGSAFGAPIVPPGS